jgi:hypothetical protein
MTTAPRSPADGRRRRRRTWPFTVGLLALGLAIAVADLIGGHPSTAVFAIVLFGLWALVWRLPTDAVHDLLAPDGDERDRRLSERSALVTVAVSAPVIVVGLLVETAHDTFGPFSLMAVIQGSLLVGSRAWLRRRM